MLSLDKNLMAAHNERLVHYAAGEIYANTILYES